METEEKYPCYGSNLKAMASPYGLGIEWFPLYGPPYRCPICGGNGIVPNGFYRQTSGQWSTTDIVPETCRTCNGTGIVWG